MGNGKKREEAGKVRFEPRILNPNQKIMTLRRLTLVQSWGFLSLKISLFGCNVAFSLACSFDLILSISRHKIGVLKSPAKRRGRGGGVALNYQVVAIDPFLIFCQVRSINISVTQLVD